MGALVFYNAEHRILISGDALWEHGFGFVMPPAIDPAALPATRATVETLATLDVRVVIPGHGEPFTDVGGALDRARRRIVAFEADRLRMARHALKALMFVLLDRRRMSLADVPAYVERVGIYRELNARYFRLPPTDLAELLVARARKVGCRQDRRRRHRSRGGPCRVTCFGCGLLPFLRCVPAKSHMRRALDRFRFAPRRCAAGMRVRLPEMR